MTLRQTIERLDALTNWEARPRVAMRPGLKAITDLATRLGSPQDRFRTIHVAGSKGKGSVAALVDAGLRAGAVRTARYASPHLERINERIVLQGLGVTDDLLSGAIDQVLNLREQSAADSSPARDATWFDILTIAAFVIFAKEQPDWAIVEVGLGGRFDSTNIATASIAIITNIELEHTEVLGRTREEIAWAKAGIIKTGATVVCGVRSNDPVAEIFRSEARQVGAIIHFVADAVHDIDTHNLALATAALDEVGKRYPRANAAAITGSLLTETLAAESRLPGRLERLRCPGLVPDGAVDIVLDGAHVAESMTAVLQRLRRVDGLGAKPIVLLALGPDKDADRIIEALSTQVDALIVTRLDRGGQADVEARIVAAAKRRAIETIVCEKPAEAVVAAARLAWTRGTWLLITGSLHLVGTVGGDLRTSSASKQ